MSKPIVHDVTSCEPISWKVSRGHIKLASLLHCFVASLQMFAIDPHEIRDEDVRKAIEKISRTIRSLQ